MPRAKKAEVTQAPKEATVGQSELAQAIVQAIELAKPREKKTPMNRVSRTPWSPKDGSPKLKFKRKMYHHGLLLSEDRLSNEEIELLNKIKPGRYCDNHVKVTRRRDKGVDVDYPVRTAAQRLKLVNLFGIRNFVELLQRIVNEGENPKSFASEEDLD